MTVDGAEKGAEGRKPLCMCVIHRSGDIIKEGPAHASGILLPIDCDPEDSAKL
jgi:hypothetical protein